ncbi:MAG TPA: response regulator [Candidatus Acidoferrales bacterium]|nr:response regulator [Candidatus Acidoferrales bacterium]
MNEGALPETLLTRLGYAVLEDAGAGALRLVGPAPEWFVRAFGKEAKSGRFVPADSSPYLENFLTSAEAAWKGGAGPGSGAGNQEQRVESGEWIEVGADGREIALEAEALLLGERRILLVANLQARFEEKSRMLQIARVDKLAHDRLLREIQTKEILLHCIVHDLSQPLTALRGCLALMTMDLSPEKMKEVVEIADRQTRKQEGMIRDVLKAFSSEMAAAAGAGADQAVDVRQGAREVVTEYAAAFASQGANLALDARLDGKPVEGGDWRATGEPDRLRRMFTNYLENALRYSSSGTVVTVGVEEDAGFLRAFVDDQGPGLPEGVTAANLFRLFGKGKESKGKVGLGLYFCKITAERWGGSVGCENRAEGGTRFWFRLPRPRAAAAAAQAAAGAAPAVAAEKKESQHETEETASPGGDIAAAPSEGAPPRKLRILVADDVDVNRTIAAQLLESRGHQVISVDDGAPAVEAFRAERFDVVLLDVEMGAMGGLEATRAMRRIEKERGSRARILAMTGHGTPQDLRNCLQAGMDGRVLKPFQVDVLFHEVEEAAPEQPAVEPAGEQAVRAEPPDGPKGFREQLLARCAGDAALVAKLARIFLKDEPRLLSAVRQAVAEADAEKLSSSAHAIKGVVGHFGAQEAREAARRLEEMGRREDLKGLAEAFAALEAAVAPLRQELEKIVGERTKKAGASRRSSGKEGA